MLHVVCEEADEGLKYCRPCGRWLDQKCSDGYCRCEGKNGRKCESGTMEVCRLYDDSDQLLYVGIAGNVIERTKET